MFAGLCLTCKMKLFVKKCASKDHHLCVKICTLDVLCGREIASAILLTSSGFCF